MRLGGGRKGEYLSEACCTGGVRATRLGPVFRLEVPVDQHIDRAARITAQLILVSKDDESDL
eukprot:scaffold269095_cov28-Tisochrysis_lutea.AAC.1